MLFHTVLRTVVTFIMSWDELFYTLWPILSALELQLFSALDHLWICGRSGRAYSPVQGVSGGYFSRRKATRTCRGNSSYMVARLEMRGAAPPRPLRSISHQLIKSNDVFTFLWRVFKIISSWLGYFRKDVFYLHVIGNQLYPT